MTTYAYIDNSNLFIEGCRVSAVKKGMAQSIHEAIDKRVVDHQWQLDYGKLYEFVCGDDAVARLWGSPPPGDSFWNMLDQKGFNPTVYERNAANKEKDEIILVAGDSDYVPVIDDLRSEGYRVEVIFWGHAARELREASSKFTSLDNYLTHFTRL